MIYIKWIVLLYFIAFQIFWAYVNKRTEKKTGLSVKAKSKEVRIAVILGGVIFTVVLISLFTSSFYSIFVPISFLQSDLLTILGFILLFIGSIIGILSARELGTSWRIGILEDQKTELVQTGIYKFCRNPYFLSYYIVFLALFLIIPSVVLLLLSIPTILWFHRMVKGEEKYLEKVHGSEYLEYCERVNRYLPKLKRNSNVKPRIEYFFLGLRDKLGIPFKSEEEVNKLGLKEGQEILDYGCGIGSYTFPAAKLVGEKGKVYALDKQPLAIKKIEEKARREGLHNVDTILSNEDTGLPDESVDTVLLYGVLPEIERREPLLRELYRVLKPDGYLSTRFCFRMKKDKVLEIVEGSKLFSLREQKGHMLNFSKKNKGIEDC